MKKKRSAKRVSVGAGVKKKKKKRKILENKVSNAVTWNDKEMAREEIE